MKPIESLPRRLWKNGHQKSSSVPIYLPLQLSTATALLVFCKNSLLLKSLFQSVPPFVSFFSTKCVTFFFHNPSAHSMLLYLNTLLLANPFTCSHLFTTDTLISPGFILLQEGLGCPSDFTLIAVWGHRAGLFCTSSFVPFSCYPSFQLPSSGLLSLVPLICMPHICCFFFQSPFSDILFLFSFLSHPVPHFLLMQTIRSWLNLNITRWDRYLNISCYYCDHDGILHFLWSKGVCMCVGQRQCADRAFSIKLLWGMVAVDSRVLQGRKTVSFAYSLSPRPQSTDTDSPNSSWY